MSASKLFSVTNRWSAPIDLPVAGSLRKRRINSGETVTDRFVLNNRPHILRWVRLGLLQIADQFGAGYALLVDESGAYFVDDTNKFFVAA